MPIDKKQKTWIYRPDSRAIHIIPLFNLEEFLTTHKESRNIVFGYPPTGETLSWYDQSITK